MRRFPEAKALFLQQRFVDLDTQSRAGQPPNMAIDEHEDRRVDEVVEQIVAGVVVVDAQALLLDQEVRRGEGDLQARRERDRPQRAVRREKPEFLRPYIDDPAPAKGFVNERSGMRRQARHLAS